MLTDLKDYTPQKRSVHMEIRDKVFYLASIGAISLLLGINIGVMLFSNLY